MSLGSFCFKMPLEKQEKVLRPELEQGASQ